MKRGIGGGPGRRLVCADVGKPFLRRCPTSDTRPTPGAPVPRRLSLLAALTAVAVAALAACGSSLEATGTLDAGKLTIYSAQHKDLTEEWAKEFQDRSGVQVQIRYGNDSSMGAQIVQEGASSPADVFLT